MKLQVFVLVVLMFCAWSPVYCATDTPETRHHEADRYLQAIPPKALFEDMADKMATNLPADQRQQFKQMMTKDLDIAALSKAMTDAMVKHFTTEELKALADFYGSPVGKSWAVGEKQLRDGPAAGRWLQLPNHEERFELAPAAERPGGIRSC